MELNIGKDIRPYEGIGDVAVLQLAGNIDQKSAPVLDATVGEMYEQGICHFILDLTDTNTINSSGIGILINITHQVNMAKGGICIINASEKQKTLFGALGLGDRLPIYANEEEGIAAFKG